jgi:hypothetical protein
MVSFKNKKNKYYVIFVKKEHGIFKRMSKKRISAMTEKVRRKKHSYFINIGFPTYSRGLKVFYFVDISKGQLISLNTEIKKKVEKKIKNGVVKSEKITEAQVLFKGGDDDPIMSPKILDKLVSQNIVSQLTSNLSDGAIKMNIISIVLGLIIGALSGYLYAVSV